VNYIFIFVGEFGYELFNWQGVIRKFSKTISPADKIICCSRANVYPFYETASYYIDISEVDCFKDSVASCYYALSPDDLSHNENHTFNRRLNGELKTFILSRLNTLHQLKLRPRWLLGKKYHFIFSSSETVLNGCVFGCDIDKWWEKGTIYERLDLENNAYEKIEPDLTLRSIVEQKLGWNPDTPFVLCQTRTREINIRSEELVPKELLIKELAKKIRVVLLTFETGRMLDSYGVFQEMDNCFVYSCNSFPEQTCLVNFAKSCLFFTEAKEWG